MVSAAGEGLDPEPGPGLRLEQQVRDRLPLSWPEGKPDLVVIVDSPDVPAGPVAGRARRLLGRSIPVLAIVDRRDDEALEAALSSGATDVIGKPFGPRELSRRLTNVLAQARRDEIEAHYEAWAAEQVEKVRAALEAQEEELVEHLARVGEYRDSDTGEHVARMARYCWIIADELGFDREQCRFLSLAAQMHDIGKVGIPDVILHKQGRLTAEEFEAMKRHTLIGQAMLKDSRSPLLRLAEIISVTHHERWDGSGYPFGLAGTAIPVAGRIAAVADVFDAVTSSRCYKSAWTSAEARSELLAGRGTLFDPACVDAMLRRWDEVLQVMKLRDAA